MWVHDIREIYAFVRGGVVRVRMGRTPKHRGIRQKTAQVYAVSDAEHTDIPARNHPGESGPREVLGHPPHLRPQRGPAALLAMGDLHTQSRKISGRGKIGQAGPAVPAVDLAETQRRPPALWISFPPGKSETEGKSDKTAASCARGISLHPWYAGQLSAIHFWDRYTQIAKRLGIWK